MTELSGSESVVHFELDSERTWVSQSHGVHPFEVGRAGAALHGHRADASTFAQDGS